MTTASLSPPGCHAVPDSYAAGVLTTAAAVDLFGRGNVRHQIASGRWQRPCRGVVVMHNGPPTTGQRDWVALLASAPGSALAGIDALRVDGLSRIGSAPTGPVSVTVPAGSRRPPRELVRAHWSEQLGAEDVNPGRAPRRTRPARSAIDEASWSEHERWSRVVVLATVQQRLARPASLFATLSRRGSPRHRALILETIHDAHGGIHSLPERDFEAIRRRWRIPEPSRQSVLRRPDGRFYLDVEWRRYGSACEIHGIPHSWVARWDADIDRTNEIALCGPRLLIFTSYAVRRRQMRVGDQLIRLLRRGGWAGG
ncbi:MAG: hypothetical protein M3353_06620 [Actinomycetota bacterium]|nr:hypothetical protein [Actinomycetota bacterium]